MSLSPLMLKSALCDEMPPVGVFVAKVVLNRINHGAEFHHVRLRVGFVYCSRLQCLFRVTRWLSLTPHFSEVRSLAILNSVGVTCL